MKAVTTTICPGCARFIDTARFPKRENFRFQCPHCGRPLFLKTPDDEARDWSDGTTFAEKYRSQHPESSQEQVGRFQPNQTVGLGKNLSPSILGILLGSSPRGS